MDNSIEPTEEILDEMWQADIDCQAEEAEKKRSNPETASKDSYNTIYRITQEEMAFFKNGLTSWNEYCCRTGKRIANACLS